MLNLGGGRLFPSSNHFSGESNPLSLSYCNGRALDRVTKQKHRPNRQKLSKKMSENCVFSPSRQFLGHFSDNFSTFFGHFVDIPIFWAVPTICPLQLSLVSNQSWGPWHKAWLSKSYNAFPWHILSMLVAAESSKWARMISDDWQAHHWWGDDRCFCKSFAIHLPLLSRYFCKSMPSSRQKIAKAHYHFVSRYGSHLYHDTFAGSIRHEAKSHDSYLWIASESCRDSNF